MSLLPVAAILLSPRRRRNRLAQALLPTFLPAANAAQRIVVGTVVANDQVRREERREAQVAEQTAAAVQQARLQNAPISDLSEFPVIARIEESRPGILTNINTAAGQLVSGNGHPPPAQVVAQYSSMDSDATVNARTDGLESHLSMIEDKISGIETTLKAIQDQLLASEKKVAT